MPSIAEIVAAALHATSAICTVLLLLLYLRFRCFSPQPAPIVRGYVRLTLALALAALLLHAVRAVRLLLPVPPALCVTVTLLDAAAILLCTGFALSQAMNLHRVFLLRNTKRHDRTERWYYLGTLVFTAVIVGIAPAAAAGGGPDALKDTLCTAESAAQPPAWFFLWQWIMLGALALPLIYVIAIVSSVSAVVAVIERDLRKRKKQEAAQKALLPGSRRKPSLAVASYAAYTASAAKEAAMSASGANTAAASSSSSWINDYLVGQRAEDRDTLKVVRHITMYPTWSALVLVPMVIHHAMLAARGGAVPPALVTVAQIFASLLGLGLFLTWAMDPSLWSVVAAERDHLAKVYVEESRRAFESGVPIGLWTGLRHAWLTTFWLTKRDLDQAEAKARRAVLEYGMDPNLPLESMDSDLDPYAATAMAPPRRPSAASLQDEGRLRRGSAAHLRAARKNSMLGTRRPSVAPHLRGPSPIPELSEDEDDLGADPAQGNDPIMPRRGSNVRRPSAAMHLQRPVSPLMQSLRRGSKSPIGANILANMAVHPGQGGPGGFRRGSMVNAQEISLGSDSEPDADGAGADGGGGGGGDDGSDEHDTVPMSLGVVGMDMRRRAYSMSKMELGVPRPRARRPSEML